MEQVINIPGKDTIQRNKIAEQILDDTIQQAKDSIVCNDMARNVIDEVIAEVSQNYVENQLKGES